MIAPRTNTFFSAAMVVLSVTVAFSTTRPARAQAPAKAENDDTHTAPASVTLDDVLVPVTKWLDTLELDAVTRQSTLDELGAQFDAGSLDPETALNAVADTLANYDERAKQLLVWCRADSHRTAPEAWEWLMDSSTAPLLRNNLRLYLGRWYTQRELYDEALHLLDQLDAESVVAPAMLVFYRSICLHQLVESSRAHDEVDRLLTSFHSLPERYDAIAALLQHDLADAKEGSLDEISRRMGDVRRRLSLGRSGERVQDVETRIVDALDDMIEKLEEQERDQQSSSSSPSGNRQPSGSPAQDSQLLGGSGRGNTAPRDFRNEDAWGNLSPKDRQEALQLLGKDLPAHYRSAVEQYFRTLATQSATEDNK